MKTFEIEMLVERLTHEIEATEVLLQGKGYTPEERLTEKGYLSGLRFAQTYAKNLLSEMQTDAEDYQNTIEAFEGIDFTLSDADDKDDYYSGLDESLKEY